MQICKGKITKCICLRMYKRTPKRLSTTGRWLRDVNIALIDVEETSYNA